MAASRKSISELDERELVALAISSEEEDGRIYLDFAEGLRDGYPDSSRVFIDMAAEESEHRRRLIDIFVQKFGDHIPLIRRQDIRDWVQRRPHRQVRALGIEAVRGQARQMEQDAARFYVQAAGRTSDAAVRKLLGDLAQAEMQHEKTAGEIEAKRLPGDAREKEDGNASRRFVLQIIQLALWFDGWFSLDPGPGLCRRVRHS